MEISADSQCKQRTHVTITCLHLSCITRHILNSSQSQSCASMILYNTLQSLFHFIGMCHLTNMAAKLQMSVGLLSCRFDIYCQQWYTSVPIHSQLQHQPHLTLPYMQTNMPSTFRIYTICFSGICGRCMCIYVPIRSHLYQPCDHEHCTHTLQPTFKKKTKQTIASN